MLDLGWRLAWTLPHMHETERFKKKLKIRTLSSKQSEGSIAGYAKAVTVAEISLSLAITKEICVLILLISSAILLRAMGKKKGQNHLT